MAYIPVGEDESMLGSFSCGPACHCASCRPGISGFAERYVPEEDEEPEPGRTGGYYSLGLVTGERERAGVTAGGLRQGRTMVFPPTTIRVRSVIVLDRFLHDQFRLMPFHTPMIDRLAGRIVASWRGSQPVRTIHLVGHTDRTGRGAYNVTLGLRRAQAIRSELIAAIERLSPGLTQQMNIMPQSLGETRPVRTDQTPEGRARNRRVAVFLSSVGTAPAPPGSGPTPPPTSAVPPTTPPSPSPSGGRRVDLRVPFPPIRPETPDERVQRLLTTPPPAPPPRRSLNQMFWQKVDDSLSSTMGRLGVPQSLRGPIRDAAHGAIERGTQSVLDHMLDRTDLSSEAKEAIRATIRAAMQTPIR
jgi:outer membrane protein OmpA-like peptidoglycan-associated protein